MGAEYWEYDTRVGRRWNLDPKPTVGISQYSAFNNNPILYNDIYGDTVSPQRTRGVNFIVLPSEEIRNKDIKAHGSFASAYNQDYKKALRMEKKSGGKLKIIESSNSEDAVKQIINNLGDDGYVKNILIDFHAGSFGRSPENDKNGNPIETNMDAYNSDATKTALKELASGYAGTATNVYLGQCWAGGNKQLARENLT